MKGKRPFAFWFLVAFLAASAIMFTLAISASLLPYDDAKPEGLYGKMERGLAVGGLVAYLPLVLFSIIGLLLKKRWSLLSSTAALGITAYWPTTHITTLLFPAADDAVTYQIGDHLTQPSRD